MRMEKPIIFNAEMVRAILDGRKTQTRRVVTQCGTYHPSHDYLGEWIGQHMYYCPYGRRGTLLWVRETFLKYDNETYLYRADDDLKPASDWRWKPSIHMPKAACRLWLEVADIRVERVQEIHRRDAQKEGILCSHCS